MAIASFSKTFPSLILSSAETPPPHTFFKLYHEMMIFDKTFFSAGARVERAASGAGGRLGSKAVPHARKQFFYLFYAPRKIRHVVFRGALGILGEAVFQPRGKEGAQRFVVFLRRHPA